MDLFRLTASEYTQIRKQYAVGNKEVEGVDNTVLRFYEL